MSESMPEGGGSGGNVWTKKLGPLPLWGWMGIAALIAVMYYLYRKNQAANSTTSSASTAQTASTNNTPGGVDSSLVPQFVNQVYNQESPPAAPNVTVNNTVPASATAPSTTAKPLNEVLTAGHAISTDPAKAVIGWTSSGVGSSGATQLEVILNGPGVKNQKRYVPASATTATFDSLEPGHTYVASITPVNSTGQAVGGPNNITFVTSKS